MAQRKLVDMGPSVVPALERAGASADDPEVRSRSVAAIRKIRDRDANDVSLVTLHVQDAPALSVLDALGAQAHAKLVVMGFSLANGGLAARTLTVDADRQPFWDVMVGVCKQLRVCPMSGPAQSGTLRLFPVAQNWMVHSPHQLVGPYLMSVASLTRNRVIDLTSGAQAANDDLIVRLTVMAEPKVALTRVTDLIVDEATDDKGHSLLVTRVGRLIAPGMHGEGQSAESLICRLAYPSAGAGSRLAVLRGRVLAAVAQNFSRCEVDDVLGTPRMVTPMGGGGDVKATVARQGGDYQVTLACTRGRMAEDRWGALLTSVGQVSLEDPSGHALRVAMPIGIHSVNMLSFEASGRFSRTGAGDGVGEPSRLVWSYPTSSKAVELPILFKDLPMP